jgi:hypothetical protein
MERSGVIRGKLRGRDSELDGRVDALDGDVEVLVRSLGATPRAPEVIEVIPSG